MPISSTRTGSMLTAVAAPRVSVRSAGVRSWGRRSRAQRLLGTTMTGDVVQRRIRAAVLPRKTRWGGARWPDPPRRCRRRPTEGWPGPRRACRRRRRRPRPRVRETPRRGSCRGVRGPRRSALDGHRARVVIEGIERTSDSAEVQFGAFDELLGERQRVVGVGLDGHRDGHRAEDGVDPVGVPAGRQRDRNRRGMHEFVADRAERVAPQQAVAGAADDDHLRARLHGVGDQPVGEGIVDGDDGAVPESGRDEGGALAKPFGGLVFEASLVLRDAGRAVVGDRTHHAHEVEVCAGHAGHGDTQGDSVGARRRRQVADGEPGDRCVAGGVVGRGGEGVSRHREPSPRCRRSASSRGRTRCCTRSRPASTGCRVPACPHP